MPILFRKTIKCGCIIETILCGHKTVNNINMHLLGGHNHYSICDKCKQEEEYMDTLYDMWNEDNITDDNEYGEWKKI